MNGFARLDPNDGNMDMYPLLDMIIDDMPAPEVDENAPLAMQCVTIDHSNFVGRIGIGRVLPGTIHQGDQILVVKNDGSSATATVKQLFTFDYLGRTECQEVGAGDIAAVVGIDRTDIGDVHTDPENPVELEPIEIDPRPCPSSLRLRPPRSSAATATSWVPVSSRSACSTRPRTT